MTLLVTEDKVLSCVSVRMELSVERKLHSGEEGKLLSLVFSPGKLLNQTDIKKAALHTVTEKLEVCASGNIKACFIELVSFHSHQAEETTLCLLLPVTC